MIVDKDTNQVFVSEWLQKVHPAFFSRFSELLKNVHINMALLSNTADIWCRDYMPIQLAEEDFLQYRYYPDYLTKKESDKLRPGTCRRIRATAWHPFSDREVTLSCSASR